jgi:hypothetical protein
MRSAEESEFKKTKKAKALIPAKTLDLMTVLAGILLLKIRGTCVSSAIKAS